MRVRYLGEVKACKVISLRGIQREPRAKILRDFELEVAILCQLNHPGVVNVRGAVFGAEELWLVMDLMHEGSLQARLAAQPPPTPVERLHSALDIAVAVEYLHKQGVQHRDLKNPNILLFRGEGDQLRAKLSDFGLSHSSSLLTATIQTLQHGGSPIWSKNLFQRKATFTRWV